MIRMSTFKNKQKKSLISLSFMGLFPYMTFFKKGKKENKPITLFGTYKASFP